MKKILIFTGTRAEYGLLKPLIIKLKAEKEFHCILVASGTHLSPEFGMTYHEIESDGIHVDERVEMLLSSDSAIGMSKSMGIGLISYSEVIARHTPDLVIILGDRFEALGMAQAAMLARVPIAHINGGESTFGLIDEAIRHAITKMAHLHFVSNSKYKKRVVQLGESPLTVFDVGALGVENALTVSRLSKKELEEDLGFKFKRRNILVTFHPVTLQSLSAGDQVRELLAALDEVKDCGIIVTKANADAEGRLINDMVEAWAGDREHVMVRASLGVRRYLSVVACMDAVVGNSSSGIIEVPSFGVPTVNIGSRQQGRMQSSSIINVEPNKKSIFGGIEKALSAEFKKHCEGAENPYGNGETSSEIVRILKEKSFDDLLVKAFHDLP